MKARILSNTITEAVNGFMEDCISGPDHEAERAELYEALQDMRQRFGLEAANTPAPTTEAEADLVIHIVAGVATVEKAPAGLRIIQRDYDTEGASPEDFDSYTDDAGKECFHSAWVAGSTPPPLPPVQIRIERDPNGNKVARLVPGGGVRSFTVQTLGNMPLTHNAFKVGDVIYHPNSTPRAEMQEHLKDHGTDRQRALVAQYY